MSYISNKYLQFFNKHHYIPKYFNPYNMSEIKEVAPTQTANCGQFGVSATVLILERVEDNNELCQR